MDAQVMEILEEVVSVIVPADETHYTPRYRGGNGGRANITQCPCQVCLMEPRPSLPLGLLPLCCLSWGCLIGFDSYQSLASHPLIIGLLSGNRAPHECSAVADTEGKIRIYWWILDLGGLTLFVWFWSKLNLFLFVSFCFWGPPLWYFCEAGMLRPAGGKDLHLYHICQENIFSENKIKRCSKFMQKADALYKNPSFSMFSRIFLMSTFKLL